MAVEDVSGIPDVELGPIMDDLKNQQDEEKPTKIETKPVTQDVKQDIKKDLAQFKNEDDLLASYKNLQGAYTKTSQQNKNLEAKITELQEQISLSRDTSINMQPDPAFDDTFGENAGQSIHTAILTSRIAEILEEIQDANPDEFQERYAYAQGIVRQHPHLGRTPGGIRKAFRAGDKLREDTLKSSASKSLQYLGLDMEDVEIIKEMRKGRKPTNNNNSDAYMPDTSTSTMHTSQTDRKPDTNAAINEAVQKGDVDGVLDNMFKTILAE